MQLHPYPLGLFDIPSARRTAEADWADLKIGASWCASSRGWGRSFWKTPYIPPRVIRVHSGSRTTTKRTAPQTERRLMGLRD